MFKPDKSKMFDKMDRPLTQSLFLEIGYNTDFAMYTLGDEDKEYKGKIYPSLKKLYIEFEDPIEYNFASTYLINFAHWERMNENKLLLKHFEQWRKELELSIRSSALRSIIDQADSDNGYQASKLLLDRGWVKRKPGRPSKEEKMREDAFKKRVEEEFNEDIVRMGSI